MTRTRCSWVSSQKASKRSVSESTGSSRSGEGLEGAASVGCGGGGGGGGETRTGQCPPGDLPRVQNEPDSREARPRSRARGRSRRPPQVAGHPVCLS